MLTGIFTESTVMMCDRDLRIIAVEGPQWLLERDLDADELRGRLLPDTLPLERLSLLEPYLEEALAGEAGYTEFGSADRIFALQVLPLRPTADEVSGLLVVTRDVTAERKAELELLRSEAQLAQAQRMAQIGSWEWRIESGEVKWSDELYRLLGLSPREFQPSFGSYLERVHPEDRERVGSLVRRAVTDRSLLHYRCRIVRADGEVRTLESHGEVLVDDAGEPERMLGTAQDVTDRTRAHDQLALASALALAIAGADSVEDGLCLTLRMICERTGWTLGEAWVRGDDGCFRVGATWSIADTGFQAFREGARSMSVAPGSGIVGRVAGTRRPAWIEDLGSDPDFLRPGEARSVGLVAAMAVPVLADDEAVAVLVLFGSAQREPDEPVVALTAGAAAQLGASISHKQAQDELRRNRLQLSQAQTIAQIGSWEWDLTTNEVTLSDEATRITGMAGDRFQADSDESILLVHPDDRERASRLMRRTLEENAEFDFHHRIVRSDGAVRAVHSQGTIVKDEQRKPARVVGTVRDVTDQRLAQEEHSRFWELSLDLLAIAGLDGYFRRVNPAYERLLGYSEQELLERPCVAIVHPEDRERFLDEAARLAETGGETRDFELRIRRRDGAYISVLSSAKMSLDPGLIYAVSKDITDRKQSEQALLDAHLELEQRTDELERSNLELEQFAYDASHDLIEPLAIVSQLGGRLGTRYADVLGDEGRQMITSIVDGSERMQMLISDLLEYSRASRDPLELQTVDCGRVLNDTLDLLADTIAEKGGSVSSGPLPVIDAHPGQIGQLFQNLLSNALKFSDGLPRVHFAAKRGEGHWHFMVSDNGIGIDPLHAARVFEMFRRLNSRDNYAGTGMGLSICKRIVERHGGCIWVEPGSGGGSVFHFTVPDTGSSHPG